MFVYIVTEFVHISGQLFPFVKRKKVVDVGTCLLKKTTKRLPLLVTIGSPTPMSEHSCRRWDLEETSPNWKHSTWRSKV